MKNMAFNRDYKVVSQAIVDSLIKEGTDPKGLEAQIENISLAYMVPVKAQWLKVSTLSESGLAKFLGKYQESTTIAMQLLQKYDFDSLVKTYRTVNLSPKTKKVLCGIDRYQDFVNSVNNGKIKVLVSTETKKPKKATNVNSVNITNAFLGSVQPKKVVQSKPKVVKKQPKAKPTLKESTLTKERFSLPTNNGKGTWVQVFTDEYLKDRALVRIIKDDKKELFGRFLYIKSSKVNKTQFFRIVTKSARFIDVDIKDIFMVMKYQPTSYVG